VTVQLHFSVRVHGPSKKYLVYTAGAAELSCDRSRLFRLDSKKGSLCSFNSKTHARTLYGREQDGVIQQDHDKVYESLWESVRILGIGGHHVRTGISKAICLQNRRNSQQDALWVGVNTCMRQVLKESLGWAGVEVQH
jgi:hypothetical protein